MTPVLSDRPVRRLPEWLRKNLSAGHQSARTDGLLKELGLNTICESGRCPNRDECYSQRTATFMVMGNVCTRSCRYCAVGAGRPEPLDADEPRRVVEAVNRLGLEHVVVTSVNRDDLPDEGAGHFAEIVRRLKSLPRPVIVEILTPDFKRTQPAAVAAILEAGPDIFNHNTETVPRLYRRVRPQAVYEKSLQVFREIRAAGSRVLTKSGLMLGLGETSEEVLAVLADLRQAGCDMLTLGQYLQADGAGVPVEEYVHPDEFDRYRRAALGMGFEWVESGPFVRSSYHARDSFEALKASLEARRA